MNKNVHIRIKNIYYMLCYAFTTLREDSYADIGKEQFDKIYDLFAAILAKGIGVQLKQGLYKEYVNHVEDLPVIHGKISMPGTIRNRMNQRMAVTCDFDELSVNNIMNQILKSTAYLLLRQKDVKEKYKAELKREMLLFSEVDKVDLRQVRWRDLQFQRNNRTYSLLIGICQMLAEGSLMTTERGEYHLASFIDDQRMCRLYEKFILEYYAQEYSWVNGFSSKALQIPWALDDGNGARLPVMQTDITLTYGNRMIIIDAKYYSRTMQNNYDTLTLHSGNLYQIFTYVKNQAELEKEKEKVQKGAGHEVFGMLLYAKTDEEVVPDNVYQMSGNRISVKTLDLNQEFSRIAAQLDEIVKEYFGIEKQAEKEM
ncbi:MAG: 5-methylcytosine-specific restriction endonuclease system specificity protein McrC [Eubacterium sp.]